MKKGDPIIILGDFVGESDIGRIGRIISSAPEEEKEWAVPEWKVQFLNNEEQWIQEKDLGPITEDECSVAEVLEA